MLFSSFFISCLIELKFCKVSWNSISKWTCKFQLSILKNKKVLFLKKKTFFWPFSISKQKSFVYWLNFLEGFGRGELKATKSFPYNLYLLMLIGIGFQDLKNLRRILLWRIGMSERQDFSFLFQLTASGVRWKLNDFLPRLLNYFKYVKNMIFSHMSTGEFLHFWNF